MKKGNVIINLLVVIVIIGIFSIPVIATNKREKERKEVFTTYFKNVNSKIKNVTPAKLESTINELKNSESVSCENIVLVDGNKVLIENCSVKESYRKYCYYDDKIYNCDSKSYEKMYLGLGIDPNGELIVPKQEYTKGTLLKVEVTDDTYYNFYVLNDNGDTVTLIMDRNIGNDVAWVSEEDIELQESIKGVDIDSMTDEELYLFLTELGPVTAKNQLPKTWINAIEVRLPNAVELISQTKWYQRLTKEQKKDWENLYSIDEAIQHEEFKASVQTCGENNRCYRQAFTAYEEAAGQLSKLLPTWLDINLYTSGDSSSDSNGNYKYAYWVSDVNSLSSAFAWSVSYGGNLDSMIINYSDTAGVRPVITIDKKHIAEKLTFPIYVDGIRK